MKLMPKSEVERAKAAAKTVQINEGLKIARRVDATRETLQVEEKKLEEFRTKRVKEIHEEIKPLEAERDTLIREVDLLKRDRKDALIPLDKEWAEVREAKKQAEHVTANAQSLLATAHEADRQAKLAVRKAGDIIARAITKEERARASLATAASAEKSATATLRSAKKVEARALKLEEDGLREFAARDNAYALKESGLILREANLTESEADLAKGWKLLDDRKAAFERRITRAKT